jgi:hypothetical protein
MGDQFSGLESLVQRSGRARKDTAKLSGRSRQGDAPAEPLDTRGTAGHSPSEGRGTPAEIVASMHIARPVDCHENSKPRKSDSWKSFRDFGFVANSASAPHELLAPRPEVPSRRPLSTRRMTTSTPVRAYCIMRQPRRPLRTGATASTGCLTRYAPPCENCFLGRHNGSAHGAPARAARGVGAPQATEPGCGGEPHVRTCARPCGGEVTR